MVTTEELVKIEKISKKHRKFFLEIERNISKITSESRDFIVEAISGNVFDINESLNGNIGVLLSELETYFANDADSYIDRLQKQMKYARNFIINAYADFVFGFGGYYEDYFLNDFTVYYQQKEFDVSEVNPILEDAGFKKLPLKA